MTMKHSKPYLLGRAAALAGKPITDQPYKTGRHVYTWLLGWREAQSIVPRNAENGSKEHLDALSKFFGI